jgi:hypothetical protein
MNKIILILFVPLCTILSCTSNKKTITCDGFEKNEIVENALYHFEKDASRFLNAKKERSNTFFLRFLLRYSNGNLDFSEMVTKNTISSLKELKAVDGLYYEQDDQLFFNYSSEIYQCMFQNFPKHIQTIFKQLEDSDYLNPEFTAKTLQSQDHNIVENKYIKAYIILGIYYPTVVNNSQKKIVNLN